MTGDQLIKRGEMLARNHAKALAAHADCFKALARERYYNSDGEFVMSAPIETDESRQCCEEWDKQIAGITRELKEINDRLEAICDDRNNKVYVYRNHHWQRVSEVGETLTDEMSILAEAGNAG